MSYVVTENCIKCKYMDCVEVCPVDCFHEGESMLVIDPGQCIDCGICVPECGANAIRPDADAGLGPWAGFNRKYAGQWPGITRKKAPPEDASAWDGVAGKLLSVFGTSDPGAA